MDSSAQDESIAKENEGSTSYGRVFAFGDQTVAFEDDLRQLLHKKDVELLASFTDNVAFVLREEIGSLPASQQEWFPRFSTIFDLVAKAEETVGAPVLKFTLLCLHELCQFIQ
jgi:naphtho-gamma-pyrone polyketide synthase